MPTENTFLNRVLLRKNLETREYEPSHLDVVHYEGSAELEDEVYNKPHPCQSPFDRYQQQQQLEVIKSKAGENWGLISSIFLDENTIAGTAKKYGVSRASIYRVLDSLRSELSMVIH